MEVPAFWPPVRWWIYAPVEGRSEQRGPQAPRPMNDRDGTIRNESCADNGNWELDVSLPRKRYEQLMKKYGALQTLRHESSA